MVRLAAWVKFALFGAGIGALIFGVASREPERDGSPGSRAGASMQAAPPEAPLRSKLSTVRIDTVAGRAGHAALDVTSTLAAGRLEVISTSDHVDVTASPSDRSRVYNGVVSSRVGLGVGVHTGVLTVALCDPACDGANTARLDIPYQVHVAPAPPAPPVAGEWATYQGDAAHTGYMPIGVEVDKLRLKWTWQRTGGGCCAHPVVTADGRAYVSEPAADGVAYLRALDEDTGRQVWEQAFTGLQYMQPAATGGGRVFVVATGTQDSVLHALATTDATPVFGAVFPNRWSTLAPTVREGLATVGSAGGTFAFAADGVRRWAGAGSLNDSTTPAIDGEYVYSHDGSGLDVYNAATGALVREISHASPGWGGYAYHAAPMLGAPDHVFAFVGTYTQARPLVAMSVANGTERWRSARRYAVQPAYAGGVVYTASNDPRSFDAISEATGQVLWSWVPPVNAGEFLDGSKGGNVLLTRDFAFVSTTTHVYAIDLVLRKAVWSYPAYGTLSMSPRGTLFINPRHWGTGPAPRGHALGR